MDAFVKFLLKEDRHRFGKTGSTQTFIKNKIYEQKFTIYILDDNFEKSVCVLSNYINLDKEWLEQQKLTLKEQAAFMAHRLKGNIKYER